MHTLFATGRGNRGGSAHAQDAAARCSLAAWPMLLVAFVLPGTASADAATERQRYDGLHVAPPVTVHAPVSLAGMKRVVRDNWESAHNAVARRIGTSYPRPVTVYIGRNTAEVNRIFAEQIRPDEPRRDIPDGFAGWALPVESTIVLNAAAFQRGRPANGAMITLRHELSHLILGEYQDAAGKRWPAWFEEGVCQWVQRSIYRPTREVMAIRSGTVAMPSLESVSRYIGTRDNRAKVNMGYALSETAVRHLLGTRAAEPEGVINTFGEHYVATGGDFEAAFKQTFKISVEEYEQQLRQHLVPQTSLHAIATFVGANLWGLLFGFGGVLMVLGVWRRNRIKARVLAHLEWQERAVETGELSEEEAAARPIRTGPSDPPPPSRGRY